MKSYDFEHAKAFFAARTGFTTGLHEVDGMVRSRGGVVIVERLPGDYRQARIPGAINLPNGQWHRTGA